jgi:hypothetical protein
MQRSGRIGGNVMPKPDATQKAIVKAVRKHLRDEELAAALVWLKRAAEWEGCK